MQPGTLLAVVCVAGVFIVALILAIRYGRKHESAMRELAQSQGWSFRRGDTAEYVAKLEELVGGIRDRHVRVLMADDDPTVAAYVRKVLPEERYHIEVANNGEECLHVLRTQPRGFDLLLLDLMMPEVSGYDVLREMALSGTAADLPVVVLTNFPEARNPEEKRLLELGLVLDVLPKTAVHDNPQLLSHIIDWHLQVARDEPEAMAA